ncbi:hypothetical protein Tco_0228542 [Tanacetum coccineum]
MKHPNRKIRDALMTNPEKKMHREVSPQQDDRSWVRIRRKAVYSPGEGGKVGAMIETANLLNENSRVVTKDAPLDVIMASLYLESDTGEDVHQSIRDLRLSSSQLKILVYPEVRNPRNPWACKDEILLGDVIAANISRAEKKKKSRVVCRTHGVGSAYHARSDGVSVSVPTVAPQGLQILLADAATQTKDKESPRLLRSKSLPALFTLYFP